MKIINILLILIFGIFNVIPFCIPSQVNAADTFYSTTDDVYISAGNPVWAVAQAATTGSIAGGVYNKAQTILVGNYTIYRGFLYFDTSSIPDSAVVTVAKLSLYGYGSPCKTEDDAGHGDIGLFEGTQAIPAVADDYNNFGGVLLTAGAFSYDYDTFSNTAYNEATLNAAGMAVISKTGITKFALRLKGDVDNIAPAGNNYIQYFTGSAGVNKPKLYVEYVVYPTVTTQAVNNIMYSGGNHYALLNGNILSNGGNTTDIRGFAYGTVSVPVNPGNVAPTVSGYSTNSTTYSSALGAYTSNITGMAANTRYYVRAIAHNGIGWAYGDEVNFITLTTPTITTVAASNVAANTTQVNATVTFDGNQLCDVQFGYDTVTHAGNFAAYTFHTTSINNTYATGNMPYASLTSLVGGTLYYYNVQITNDFGASTGTEGTFTTVSGVSAPTNFVGLPSVTGIPAATSISLSWVKGIGSTYTLIRYKQGSYPTSKTDGNNVSATDISESSYKLTGLTMGTTYYFMAWGYSGTSYSSDNATLIATTTLGATTQNSTLSAIAVPSDFFTAPDYTQMAFNPFYDWVNWNADTFSVPRNTWWFWLAMLSSILGFIAIWAWSRNPFGAALTALAIMIFNTVGGVVPGAIAFLFCLGALSIMYVGMKGQG